MTHEHDFSKGKRGRVVPAEAEPHGKARITIRLDQDLLDFFLHQADLSGGATAYQTLINNALRLHVEGNGSQFEETLRHIVREEIRAASRLR
jgi:uncharacterized protein (DUF4415 family)